MISKKIATICFLLLFVAQIKAQKIVTNQGLYWLRYYNQLSLNKQWTWHNELEERRFFQNNHHNQLVVHSRLHYKFFQNSDVGFGVTYSLQSPQDPNSLSELVVPEIRLVQEINYTNPISKRFGLQQRLRIDERFIHKNDGKTLLDGYDFNFRFRYRLQANYTISKEDVKNQTTLKISNELMINVGKNIIYNQFDQNRLNVALERGISKHLSLELGYIYLYQQRASGNQFFDRDVLRLTIFHRI